MWHQLILLAQEGKPQGGGGGEIFNLLLPLGIFVIFFLVMILPARRQEEKARKALLANLKKNDKVLTTGGIYGTVVAISEKEDEVTVKVDDNVRLKMVKSSIARNLTNEEAAKAPKETKA
jgi:preprotein translocase subunit YajC